MIKNSVSYCETYHVGWRAESATLEEFVTSETRISLLALSEILTKTCFYGDFSVNPPWEGIRKQFHFKAPVPQNGAPQPLDKRRWCQAFKETLAPLVADRRKIAISFSGGLDSTAVLCGILEHVPTSTDVVAINAATSCNDSHQAQTLCMHVANYYGHPCTFQSTDRRADIPWSILGPARHGMPDRAAGVAQVAIEAGAEILLCGSGADELLGAHRYLTLPLLRHRRGASRAYWNGIRRESNGMTGFLGELIGIALSCAGPKLRRRIFLAIDEADLAEVPDPVNLLSGRYREHARDFDRRWLEFGAQLIPAEAVSLSQMHFCASLLPIEYQNPTGPIEEASPFMLEPLFGAACDVPLVDRFDPVYPHAYWQKKPLVMALIPSGLHAFLPTRKDLYSRAMVEDYAQAAPPRRLMDLGIIERSAFESDDYSICRKLILSMESWLEGALARGYTIQQI